jgi:outer membrane protein TolC
VALAEDAGKMTPLEYGTYLGLQSAFSAMGITSPNISKSQEYNMFIYPLEVVPKSLQNGMAQLRIGLDQAEAGVASGGEGLFDGAKQLEGVVALQKLNYEIAQDALVTAEKKFEYGQISEGAYETAANDEKIAALNYQTIQRQYDNLMMQMNVMLGQEVLTTTVLISEVGDLVELNTLDTYIESGLKKRAELKTNSANIAYQSDILDYTDKYLGTRSIDYKTAENALADYALEKAYETNAVTADIMKAYKAVAVKEENLTIKKLSLEDAQRQQSDLKLQQELGFVTESMAKQIDVLVLLAENDYEGAYREYLAAVTALELASDIGGGMSFE